LRHGALTSTLVGEIYHEGLFVITINPKAVEYTRYFDVGIDPEIKVQGEEIKEYPKFPEMKHVSLKILNWKTGDKKFVVTKAELSQN